MYICGEGSSLRADSSLTLSTSPQYNLQPCDNILFIFISIFLLSTQFYQSILLINYIEISNQAKSFSRINPLFTPNIFTFVTFSWGVLVVSGSFEEDLNDCWRIEMHCIHSSSSAFSYRFCVHAADAHTLAATQRLERSGWCSRESLYAGDYNGLRWAWERIPDLVKESSRLLSSNPDCATIGGSSSLGVWRKSTTRW